MNEQMNNAIVEVINKVTSGVEGAIEFSKEQIPDVLEQLLMWNMCESIMWLVIGLVLVVTSVKMFFGWNSRKKVILSSDYCGEDKEDLQTIWWVVLIVIGVAGIPFVIYNTLEIIKIIVAPKLYLLEYAADLVKQTKQ